MSNFHPTKETTVNSAAPINDPYTITPLDKDVIEHHIGTDVFRAFQGLTIDAGQPTEDGQMVAAIFRGAIEAAAMEVEFSADEIPTGPCTYETHPKTRQLAAERTGNAIRVMFGYPTRDAR